MFMGLGYCPKGKTSKTLKSIKARKNKLKRKRKLRNRGR